MGCQSLLQILLRGLSFFLQNGRVGLSKFADALQMFSEVLPSVLQAEQMEQIGNPCVGAIGRRKGPERNAVIEGEAGAVVRGRQHAGSMFDEGEELRGAHVKKIFCL